MRSSASQRNHHQECVACCVHADGRSRRPYAIAFGLLALVVIPLALLIASTAFAQPGGRGTGGLGGGGLIERDPTGNDYASVRLISESTTLRPDRVNWIALDFSIAEGWHLYWKFAGDTGLPPSWSWTVPEGVVVGEPMWPVPMAYSSSAGSLDYIYENRLTVLFPVMITAEAAGRGRPVTIGAEVEWLVCKDSCLPGESEVSIELPASIAPSGGDEWTSDSRRFAVARGLLPLRDQRLETWGVRTEWLPRGEGRGPILKIHADNATAIRWYPDEQSLPLLPLNRYRETAAKREGEGDGAGGVEVRVTYRPTIVNAFTVRGVLEIERGGSKVWLDVHLPPPAEGVATEASRGSEGGLPPHGRPRSIGR